MRSYRRRDERREERSKSYGRYGIRERLSCDPLGDSE